MKKQVGICLAFLWLLPAPAWAGVAAVESFGENVHMWVVRTLAPLVLMIGVAWAGFVIAMGRDGLGRAIMVVIGGVAIFASEEIVDFVKMATH